jgi:redox-sensitive bicupin YhaK (pirin superfamily)
VHAEVSSVEFKKNGGPLEILQLWINLPAKYKMTDPKYIGLQKQDIPTVEWDDGNVVAHIVSGYWTHVKGPVEPLTDIHLAYIEFNEGGKLSFPVEKDKTVFLYVVKGKIMVNGEAAEMHHLVEFSHEGTMIEIKALTKALLLFGFATPFHEPFAAYGPFVMNTQQEIIEAYEDYHAGKFGNEKSFI